MNPQELSGFITNLLRSGPEILGSFFTGVVLTGMLAYAFRGQGPSHASCKKKLAEKDVEIARKDTEIARRDAQVVRVEALLTNIGVKLSKNEDAFTDLPLKKSTDTMPMPADPPLSVDYAATKDRCKRLEIENQALMQEKQSLEQIIKNLRAELAQVSSELEHSTKWLKRFDEENARLIESVKDSNQ